MDSTENNLLVTVRCLAYNHEPYIRQCLEGFVMQKTNFRFEAIVHDDASIDGTADIIREYAEKYGCKYVAGARPWGEKGDIALPSATQNELNGDEAKQLVANGVIAVSEGANMPSTPEAIRVFQEAKILYAPGKAANAGGVSVSGLEMTQNSIKLGWSQEEVDEKLKSIMKNIHEACVQYGTEADGYVNYVKGANVAGFMKVAKAMMAQGIV